MHLLVVEDSPAARDLLRRSLEEAGHTLSLATNVADARALAGASAFDLAVIDVMLPDGSGVELCRELRAGGFTSPILFLSARGDVSDRIEGLDAGGDDYLRKPFALAELGARIRALGRRAGRPRAGSIQAGETAIDFGARRLLIAGAEVTLTAREWAVLDVLAEHAGRVVTRADVIAAAWPRPGPGASESLDVIVLRLRRKLERGAGPRIRTVRGQGFVFEVNA
jgi:DNA-binding response OmpR family regulator